MNSNKKAVASKGGGGAGKYDADTMSRLQRFIKLRRSAVIIQSLYRRNVAARKAGLIRYQNHVAFVYRTASRIQALVRACQQRKRYVLYLFFCFILQCAHSSLLHITRFAVALKAKRSKDLLRKQTAAVIMLQARTRAFQRRMRYLASLARQGLNPTLRRCNRSTRNTSPRT